jgi:Na+-driven multidrug efflux pump
MDSSGRVSSILFNCGIQCSAASVEGSKDSLSLPELSSLLAFKNHRNGYSTTSVNSPSDAENTLSAIEENGMSEASIHPHESSNIQILKELFMIAYPIALSMLFQIGGTFIVISFAGHAVDSMKPNKIVAGISIANAFSNIFCFAFINGLCAPLGKLNKFESDSLYHAKSIMIFQQSIIVSVISLIPLGLIWLLMKDFLIACSVPIDVVHISVSFFEVSSLFICAV